MLMRLSSMQDLTMASDSRNESAYVASIGGGFYSSIPSKPMHIVSKRLRGAFVLSSLPITMVVISCTDTSREVVPVVRKNVYK